MTKTMRWRRRLLTAIAVLSLMLTYMVGFAYAKYVQTHKSNGSVTITADIGTIVLQEHEAQKKPDGSYQLLGVDDDGKCDGITHGHPVENSYILLPGLDVPKDPHLVIEKPNDLPVYIFIEVVDEHGDDKGIHYEMSNWTELTGVDGPHNGAVYYYNSEITTSQTIYILDNNTVEVSQKLDKSIKDLHLTFYAYMYQAAAGSDAEQVYAYYTIP